MTAPPSSAEGNEESPVGERGRIADDREVAAERPDPIVAEPEPPAHELGGSADAPETGRDAGDVGGHRHRRVEKSWVELRQVIEQAAAFRLQLAVAAEHIADQAEAFASILEELASHGDADRRLRLAEKEREVARVERRNAAKLRETRVGPLQLEHLPEVPSREILAQSLHR